MPRIYIQKCDVLVSLLYSEVFIFIAPLYPEYLLCSPSTWAGRTSTNPCFTSTMDHYLLNIHVHSILIAIIFALQYPWYITKKLSSPCRSFLYLVMVWKSGNVPLSLFLLWNHADEMYWNNLIIGHKVLQLLLNTMCVIPAANVYAV